jgi:hypothetical protein
MHMRRFTRLTNAFSKKLENHNAVISLHFKFYNFVRIHQTLRITPAMGVTGRVWEIGDIVALLDGARMRNSPNSQSVKLGLGAQGPALGFDPIPRNL